MQEFGQILWMFNLKIMKLQHSRHFAIVSALIITAGTFIAVQSFTLSPKYRMIDPSNAASDCIPASTLYTIQNPSGYTFTKSCMITGKAIYSDDARFTFFGFPQNYLNSYYIQTGNIHEKEDLNLNWSINLSQQGQVSILYRKIPGQTVPAWIKNNYTKVTNDDYSNLLQFILRKNDQGLIGLYDIYNRKTTNSGTVPFGPASDTTVAAYSMYLVSIIPTGTVPTPTPVVKPTPTPTPNFTTPPSGSLPSSVLNLTNWKITLPTGSTGSPTEIKQPALATFKIDPWFIVQNGGVRFRAPVNGKTTSGSSNPRSELREMTNNGTVNAAWSSTSGTHSMTIDQMVTALPNTKPHLVVGQIHDAADDVTVFRVEGTTLWITDGNTTHGYAVDTNMTLGKRFTVKMEVSSGVVKYYYNGNLLPYSQKKSFSGAYFKAGAYTQANCTNSSPCADTNYGEAIIYNVAVSHQ
jgi:hypothetical protein